MGMKVYKDGMTLGRDTASITNALMENRAREIKVGDTFAELLWSDRTLWVVVAVHGPRSFEAKRAETQMKDWADGTEYPVKDEAGKIKTEGAPVRFDFRWRKWRAGGSAVHLSFGETTGYRDPSF